MVWITLPLKPRVGLDFTALDAAEAPAQIQYSTRNLGQSLTATVNVLLSSCVW